MSVLSPARLAGMIIASSLMLPLCASAGAAASPPPFSTSNTALSSRPVVTADNFVLTDTDHLAHELYRTDAKVAVIVAHATGCPAVRAFAPSLRALKARYEGRGVTFMLLNSSLRDARDAIVREKSAYGLDAPILIDSSQLVGEQLGLTQAGEMLVLDARTWTVRYRGPSHRDRTVASAKVGGGDAMEAIDAALRGQSTKSAELRTLDCPINFAGRGAVRISYSRQVAPILETKCAGCHTAGGIGPFPMSDYETVKGFAPMIREVIRTRRMPPWGADPHVRRLADDASLNPTEVKTIVHWVEQGAPRGGGVDPLAVAARKRDVPEWPLGAPDLILQIPEYRVPAAGVVEYQRPIVLNPLKEGRWVKASTYKIDQRQAVHHVLSGYHNDIPASGKSDENRWGASLGDYGVGATSTFWPRNVGTYLPPGGAVGFLSHYTPFGRDVTDASKLGLYFYKDNERPKHVMRNSVVADLAITIPPGAAGHKETAYLDFPKAALLYSAFPHAHYRGRAASLWIQYPDGEKKLLLAVPRYEFSWQHDYTFAEPVKVPPGSKIIADFWYDNSAMNPRNPDAAKTVIWGDQSWEEMFYMAIRYRWMDETSERLTNYEELMNRTRIIGVLDDDVDGKVQKGELKGELGRWIGPYFDASDADHDDSIDARELAAMLKAMGARSRREGPSASPASPASPAPAVR